MSFSLSARKIVIVAGWCSMVAVPAMVFAQGSFPAGGGEYSITGGRLPGDQVYPCASITTNGGYITWQDNAIDGTNGLGIGAMRLENDLTGSRIQFRVNSLVSGDHENPQVSMLNNGAAVFAWQGGPVKKGFRHIYARFLSPSNSWLTGDIQVNSATNFYQKNPVVATLLNGNVVIAYESLNQAGLGSMADIYFQMFTPDGNEIGSETLANQFTSNNQRAPALAALANGTFAIGWVSEQERWSDASNGIPSVDIFARIFNSDGTPSTGELLLNVSSNVCAYPSLAASPDGGFMATWMEKDLVARNNSWDIFARRFSAPVSSLSGGNVTRVNTQLYGDQYSPRIQSVGTNYLDIWTSLGQDGSREGVFGTFLNDDATTSGSEMQVNTTTLGSQMHQTLGSDGVGRFLAAWTSFGTGMNGFDLYAQKYINPSAPIGTNNPVFNSNPNANPNSVISLPPPVTLPPPPSTNSPVGVGVTNTFNDVKGVYNGLVYDPTNLTSGNSGYVTVTTTAKGSFTAKLQLGGKTYSFSGQFGASGAITAKAGPWSVNLQLDLHGGDMITGQVSNAATTLSLEANLNVFSKVNPTSLLGSYTIVVQGADDSMGNGVGTASINSSGVVQYKLTLPDGTQLSEKTTLSKTGMWPLYAAPYKGGVGVVIGWMQFSGARTNGFGGQCVWTKPTGAGTLYSGGLTNSINVQGSDYKAPPLAFRAFGGSQIVLSGGSLSVPITNSVTWGLNNKVVNGGPNKLSLSITPVSGLFKGSVVDPTTQKNVQFQGVLYEKGNVGLGFFPGGNQSGAVSFAPNP